MIFHTVLACAVLLNLSMTTKVEMQNLLPQAASFCVKHPEGRLSVTYGPLSHYEQPGFRQWGKDQHDAKTNRSASATGYSP